MVKEDVIYLDEETLMAQNSNDRHMAAMRERNSPNLNTSGKEGVKACGKPQYTNVTTTTNKPKPRK